MLFQILLRLLKIQRGWFALSEALGRTETHANVRESLEGLHTPTSKWLLGGWARTPVLPRMQGLSFPRQYNSWFWGEVSNNK